MILWIVFFILVLAISFVLALKSMRDYAEIHEVAGEGYSLFLIRKPAGLNNQFFTFLHDGLISTGKNISFERLYRGKESALVVFGPVDLLTHFKDSLDLLELEDYASTSQQLTGWEVMFKKNQADTQPGKMLEGLPQFLDTDQFWWQVILWVNKSDTKALLFSSQIRAVVACEDPARRKTLVRVLQNLPSGQLFRLPKVFSSEQISDLYKKRSFQKNNNSALDFDSILKLLQT